MPTATLYHYCLRFTRLKHCSEFTVLRFLWWPRRITGLSMMERWFGTTTQCGERKKGVPIVHGLEPKWTSATKWNENAAFAVRWGTISKDALIVARHRRKFSIICIFFNATYQFRLPLLVTLPPFFINKL